MFYWGENCIHVDTIGVLLFFFTKEIEERIQ